MARFKRTTTSLGGKARRTRTTSTSGENTTSQSIGTSNQRFTYTQKTNGQSYTTQTTRFGGGFYERKRISSYTPDRAKKTRSKKSNNATILSNSLSLVLMILFTIPFIVAVFK